MKLVYVYPQFTELAGTERVLIDKMNYLSAREEYEVILLTNQQGNHPIVFPLSNRITHIDLDVRFWELYKLNLFSRFFKRKEYYKLYSERFYSFAAEIKPDIVIASTFYSYILDVVANCPLPFVRILESHIDKRYLFSNDMLNRKSIFNFFSLFYGRSKLKRIVSKYDVLVSLNSLDFNDWTKYVRTKKILNIVHLNPTDKISNLQSKRVIFVGRYVEQKGIPDLLEIWKLIYLKNNEWHLDLYGTGNISRLLSYEDNLEKLNFHVHQAEKDIFKCYLESSMLLHTSIFEPFGLVMPEAMSCGLPVVAFDCPSGPSEIITDGVDGFLIKNRNINQFAEKVCLLIESQDLRIKMGRAAIKSSYRFSTNSIIPEWEALFNDLLSKTRK